MGINSWRGHLPDLVEIKSHGFPIEMTLVNGFETLFQEAILLGIRSLLRTKVLSIGKIIVSIVYSYSLAR